MRRAAALALLAAVRLPGCTKKNFIVYFGSAFLIKLAHNNKPLEGITHEMGNTSLQ